ncbi:MAG: Rnase Y domain-containing protein, partial [Phycisphaerae bacterium]
MNDSAIAVLMGQAGGIATGAAAGVLVGAAACYVALRWVARSRIQTARSEADRILTEARSEAGVIRKSAEVDAKAEYLTGQEKLRSESNEMRAELKEIERR